MKSSATKAANCDHQAGIKAAVPKFNRKAAADLQLQKNRRGRVVTETNDDDGQGGQ